MNPRKPSNATPKGPNSDLESLSQNDVTILAETFRLLGDPSRLRIMLCCMKGSSSVGDIAETLELSQSLVSHHLRLLRGARGFAGEVGHLPIGESGVQEALLDGAVRFGCDSDVRTRPIRDGNSGPSEQRELLFDGVCFWLAPEPQRRRRLGCCRCRSRPSRLDAAPGCSPRSRG